jgi:hypothetical protein
VCVGVTVCVCVCVCVCDSVCVTLCVCVCVCVCVLPEQLAGVHTSSQVTPYTCRLCALIIVFEAIMLFLERIQISIPSKR